MVWRHLLNQLVQGPAALALVGMPGAHEAAFRAVARSQDCVISSRELGRVGTGLVEEGYDSKGFRIKSKTCNFGPMAGFVCTNPNYSKRGVAYAARQQADINHALNDDDNVGWRGSIEHICISDARLAWLMGEPTVNVAPAQLGMDPNVLWGQILDPAPVAYVLHRRAHAVTGDMLWHLYTVENLVELQNNTRLKRLPWTILRGVLSLRPITALVNPYPAYPVGHYKNAVCGDYDLFAIWPARAAYDAGGEDRRIAGMLPGASAAARAARNAQIFAWEDRRLGNISNRVHLVAQLINSMLPAAQGAVGGRRDMVHHSDEAGRPVVEEIELPVIAFIPGAPARMGPRGAIPARADLTVAAENLPQMRSLVALCDILRFQIVLNAGWQGQLGFFASVGDTGHAAGWQTPHLLPGGGHNPMRAR